MLAQKSIARYYLNTSAGFLAVLGVVAAAPGIQSYNQDYNNSSQTQFLYNPAVLARKLGRKEKIVKMRFRLYKTKKKLHGPLRHWCREGETLVIRPLKKTIFLCVSSLTCEHFLQGWA